MKNRTLLCWVLFLCGLPFLHAQNTNPENDEYFEETGGFTSRLWYGGGFALGLSGGNYQSFFELGISPMVGYKITDHLSAGPRLSANYIHLKDIFLVIEDRGTGQSTGTIIDSKAFINFSVGAFARYKFLDFLFAHAEVGVEDRGIPTYYYTDIEDVEILRASDENVYGGLGYTQGYPMAYELLLLYNFSEPEDSFDSPFEIRVAITYQF